MPGKNITQYVEQHAEKGFHEVSSIFRHDYVQFLGMLQSWMALIEAEVMDTPDDAYTSPAAARRFKRAASQLQHMINSLFEESRARLYPQLNEGEKRYVSSILKRWDVFFDDFNAFAQPVLWRSERLMRRFVASEEFERVIEKKLGGTSLDEGDTIQDLMLKPYERLREVMDASRFDLRVAEVVRLLQSKNAAV